MLFTNQKNLINVSGISFQTEIDDFRYPCTFYITETCDERKTDNKKVETLLLSGIQITRKWLNIQPCIVIRRIGRACGKECWIVADGNSIHYQRGKIDKSGLPNVESENFLKIYWDQNTDTLLNLCAKIDSETPDCRSNIKRGVLNTNLVKNIVSVFINTQEFVLLSSQILGQLCIKSRIASFLISLSIPSKTCPECIAKCQRGSLPKMSPPSSPRFSRLGTQQIRRTCFTDQYLLIYCLFCIFGTWSAYEECLLYGRL